MKKVLVLYLALFLLPISLFSSQDIVELLKNKKTSEKLKYLKKNKPYLYNTWILMNVYRVQKVNQKNLEILEKLGLTRSTYSKSKL